MNSVSNWIAVLIITTVIFLTFAFYFGSINLNNYLLSITGLLIAIYTYSTYKLYQTTFDTNRLVYFSTLNVNKAKLENKSIIQIENRSKHIIKDVYIGSFLFTSDGEHVILYDEIQQLITKSYPIIQSGILEYPFRKKYADEDKKRKEYKEKNLTERLSDFLNEHWKSSPPKVHLVIALRTPLMTDRETFLFFYQLQCAAEGDKEIEGTAYEAPIRNRKEIIKTLEEIRENMDNKKDDIFSGKFWRLVFDSEHFSIAEEIYKNALEKINERIKRYRRERS